MIILYRITACSDPDDCVQQGYGLRFEGQINSTVFVTIQSPVMKIQADLEELDKISSTESIIKRLERITGTIWMHNSEGLRQYTMTEIPLVHSVDIPKDLNPHYIERI